MRPASILGASLLVLAGAGAAAFLTRSLPEPAAARLDSFARELQARETLRPAPRPPASDDDPSRHRAWTPDPRDRTFSAPTVTAEIGWFADGAPAGTRTVIRGDAALQFGAADAPELFLLRRNPLDPARMNGCLVRHDERLILEHTESDLRDEGYGDSWAALAQLGVHPREFDGLRATGEIESAFGLDFERHVAREEPGGSLRELWWNAEWALPLRLVRLRNGAELEQRLLALEPSAPAELGREACERWPGYRAMDLLDWREGLHDHGGH